jgi:hypothetical protein
MPLGIEVVDNADGTGATVTITGSLGGTVQIRRSAVAVDGPILPAVQVGSTVGNGTTTVAGIGYWNWYAYENIAYYTDEIYVPTTLHGDSVYERCLVMLKDRIDDLGLTTVSGDPLNVVIQQAGDNNQTNLSYPCLLLAILGQAEEVGPFDNQRDSIGYPILAQIIERTPWELDTYRGRMLQWREKIRRRVNNQKWDARVKEVWKVEVLPAPVISVPESERRLVYREGLMLFRCLAVERRNTA